MQPGSRPSETPCGCASTPASGKRTPLLQYSSVLCTLIVIPVTSLKCTYLSHQGQKKTEVLVLALSVGLEPESSRQQDDDVCTGWCTQ